MILFLICIGLTTYYLYLLWQRYQYFSRRGIPTPPFRFFYGHLKTLWNAASFHRQLETWTQQYGKIYGIYQGTAPTLVVSDPDFLQEVFIKQFSVFPGRRELLTGKIPNLFSSSGPSWHRYRHVINPTFSAAKLKMMSPLINGCISNVMDKFDDHVRNGNEFNIYIYYKRMTMDVICRCAFGIDTDIQNNPDNIYLKKIDEFFARGFQMDGFHKFAQLAPEIANIITEMYFGLNNVKVFLNTHILPLISTKRLDELSNMWLLTRLDPIIEQRLKTPTSRVDLLKLMLDVMTDEPINDQVQDSNSSKANHRLTRKEVTINILVFMAAGYETTSTALAYATYALAKHPEVLQKLQAEIDRFLSSDDSMSDEETKKYPDYDIVAQMSYLDMFVSEVFRMYPIANAAIQREASYDTVIKGIKIEKGTLVHADIFTVHYDPELWGPEDPHLFYPERHATKRHPMAYLPFGAGPRHCIGMRFALIEIKILLIRLLQEYTILPGEHLESKLNIREWGPIAPKEVWVTLVKRDA
ncbi:unnamed protein product [Adineta steineri]|uniref:Cytochrome P450 n=1 Tax=Adineta steineri TaxID=433720 RepID=A0A814G4X4_9BILA|nr:unnamed protein product [Adineta steineri]CAF4047558.1 unnamed protein product [Adineta steineri]